MITLIIVVLVILFSGLFCYSMCRASGNSDKRYVKLIQKALFDTDENRKSDIDKEGGTGQWTIK